jgi:hypothetical protein
MSHRANNEKVLANNVCLSLRLAVFEEFSGDHPCGGDYDIAVRKAVGDDPNRLFSAELEVLVCCNLGR